jgi:hypothetical protein
MLGEVGRPEIKARAYLASTPDLARIRLTVQSSREYKPGWIALKEDRMKTLIKGFAVPVLVLLVVGALFSMSASAQEDNTSQPPPLQWPSSVSAHPNGQLPFVLGTTGLRASIEKAGDTALCEMLMKDAKIPIPNEATFSYDTDCPSSIKAEINSRQGKYSWADGARPTECGRNCIGPPFMSQTQNVDRPNSIYALVYGHLTFHVDVPGPFNRDVQYGLEIDANCSVPGGSRTGVTSLTTHVDGPLSDDPGFLESIVNYLLLPAEISQRITDAIDSGYGVSTIPGPNLGLCSSIGAVASPPADYKFDAFVWDVPQPRRPAPITTSGASAIRPTATLYFDRIFRNHTIESNPSTGPFSFTIYINGVPAHIAPNSTITLAPNASYNQKYCKTVSMDGVNGLQILFTDSLGGAVWSQFTPAQNFGTGGSHKMTTGRTYFTPGLHPGDKPIAFVLREFELDYRINYSGAPTAVAPVTPPPSGVRPRPPLGGVATTGQPQQPDSSCIRI